MSAEADAAERLELLEAMLASAVELPALETDKRIKYEQIRRELYAKYEKKLRELGFTNKGSRSGGYIAIAPGAKFSPEKLRKYAFSEIEEIFSKQRYIYDTRLFTALLLFEARYSQEIKEALQLCFKTVTGMNEKELEKNGFIPLDIDGWWKPYQGDALLIFAHFWAKGPPIKFYIVYLGKIDGSPISEENVKEYLESFHSPERLLVGENNMLVEVKPSDLPAGVLTKNVPAMLTEFRTRLNKTRKIYAELESTIGSLKMTCQRQGLILNTIKKKYPYEFSLEFKSITGSRTSTILFKQNDIPQRPFEIEKILSDNVEAIKALYEAFSSKGVPTDILKELLIKLLKGNSYFLTSQIKDVGSYLKAVLRCDVEFSCTIESGSRASGYLFSEKDVNERKNLVDKFVSEWGQAFSQPEKAEELGRRLVREDAPYHEAVATLLSKHWRIAYALAGGKKLSDSELPLFEQLLLSGEGEFRELLFEKSIDYLASNPDERVADVLAKYLERTSRIECLYFINSKAHWNYSARKALETAVRRALNIPDAKLVKCGDDVHGASFSIMNGEFLLHIISEGMPHYCNIIISPRKGFAKSFSATYRSGWLEKRDIEKIDTFLAKAIEFSNQYEEYCKKRISNLAPLLKVAAIGASSLPPLPKIYVKINDHSYDTYAYFKASLDEEFEKAFRSAKYRFGRWLRESFTSRKLVTYG